jgi:rod shape-determining protein MreB
VSIFPSFGARDIAIDLGTANTLVYVRGQGIVVSEPSVVAIDSQTGDVQAVGAAAKRMIGRTPASISAIRPLRHGVIADFEVTEQMLRYFIRLVDQRRMARPRLVMCAPSGVTEVEKKAVVDASMSAGARQVHLIEEPIAAAIGAGLPIAEPVGHMVVDVGGGTSEVAVISLGGIVESESVRVGGYELDEAIASYIRREHRMAIGLPNAVVLTSAAIREALAEPVQTIIDAIKNTLERTPPELAADVSERGILLAGGGALLQGFAERVRDETGMPAQLAESPLTCVAIGSGQSLEEYDAMSRLGGPFQARPATRSRRVRSRVGG